jgi:glycosyltransferase involved in cell wall biosynthesis
MSGRKGRNLRGPDMKGKAANRKISVIIPTSDRWHILKETLPSYLSQWGVAEVVIVNDFDKAIAPEVNSAFPAPPVPIRVIDHPRNLGLCAARNTGIKAAISELILMGEDDVILSEDHIQTLFSEYQKVNADIISGVVFRLLGNESVEEAKNRARRNKGPAFDIQTLQLRMDAPLEQTTEVLYTHAIQLMRRDLAAKILFDTKIGGPSFSREDNEFCLAARRQGARIFLCPHVESIHLPRTRTYGSGTRGTYSATVMLLSTIVNLFMIVDQYFDLIQDAGYRGPKVLLKFQLASRNLWYTVNRTLESESKLYRAALNFYRTARSSLK